MPVTVELKGLDNILSKLDKSLIAKPSHDFFARVGITVQGKARQNAPVDTGNLRNEIMYEVDDSTPTLWTKVGLLQAKQGSSLWVKGRAMEYGTGRLGDPAVSHKSGHWPPASALERWAVRHGTTGAAVARAIGKAGGLRPRPYLRTGLKESMDDIKRLLAKMGDEIGQRWDRG